MNAGCTVVWRTGMKAVSGWPIRRADQGQRRFSFSRSIRKKQYLRGEVEYFDDDDADAAALTRSACSERCEVSTGHPNPDEDHPSLSFQLAETVDDLDFRNMLQRSRSETEAPVSSCRNSPRYPVKRIAPRNGSGH